MTAWGPQEIIDAWNGYVAAQPWAAAANASLAVLLFVVVLVKWVLTPFAQGVVVPIVNAVKGRRNKESE